MSKRETARLTPVAASRHVPPALHSADSTMETTPWQTWIDALDDTAVFETTASGAVRNWSEAARKVFLYDADEVLGWHLSRFQPPGKDTTDTTEAMFQAFANARADGRARFKGWQARRDGSIFVAETTLTAQPDGYVVVCRDITVEYAAGEQAANAEARSGQLLDVLDKFVACAVCELSVEGEIRSWSAGAQSLFGYTAAEVAGSAVGVLYPRRPDGQPGEAASLEAVRGKGEWVGEERLQHHDGAMLRCEVRQVLQRDSHGSVSGILWTARDMSDTARLAELEHAGHRVQAFLAILAHELRNPLAPIRNAVDVIRLIPVSDPRIRHCSEIIGRQLHLLTRLVSDLMDVGRVTSGKLKVQPVPILYNEVVSAAVEAMRPAIENAAQQLAVALPSGPVFVNGDAERLEQVMSNLLSNASKYTARGGALAVTVRVADANVITSIADNGRGIAPAALDRIFSLFAQEGDDTARTGLGIGLALARAIVEAHGGVIQATSAGEGHGSTFTVILPQVEMDGANVPRATMGECAGKRILIVDDSMDSADSMAELLTVLGHEARPVYTGMRAVELVREFAPDVVLLDLEMPDMSGFEVLPLLRAAHTGMRVFALTGRGTVEDRRRTEAAGFDAHLVKPLTVDALCRALQSSGAEGNDAGAH
ncbi:ATP-binding protein [Cupriavidus sp. DL-D2]|uniref:hybrid sensor histidine kinase/response regulator n=1 Tax=Cupriavidus sp. DL-D2 TaxID=3144974 RepID=UPI0032155815